MKTVFTQRVGGTRLVAACAVLVVIIGIARIVSTYPEFTQTMDEPVHIACGMQLLQDHVYDLEFLHPPLSRIAVALGPWLAGLRMPEEGEPSQRGNAILNENGNYWRNLALARMGTLPFFVLACAAVWFWSDRLGGKRAALFALVSFTLLPPILAHAGLATTDMAITATLTFALYRFAVWIEQPGWGAAAWVGAGVGLAVLSKFSALLFFPCGVAALLVTGFAADRGTALKRLRIPTLAAQLLIFTAVTYLVICAGYFFTGVPMEPRVYRPHTKIDREFSRHPAVRALVYAIVETPVPAAQAMRGAADVRNHNRGGHTEFFMGEWSRMGWWDFFPVLFLVKTPVPFLLLLAAAGACLLSARQRDWRILAPGACALAIMLACIPVRINIGLRHVLPIYPLLAVLAGCGVSKLWDWKPARVAMAGGLVFLAANSALSHPNYLAYFNWFASSHPEHIEVDSDLDWGQDLARLSNWLRANGVSELALSYFGSVDLDHADLPLFHELEPFKRVSGWIAISAYNRTLPSPFHVTRLTNVPPYFSIPYPFDGRKATEGPFAWLTAYTPVARVGNSIFVYKIP
jgi:hypothetical protein